MSVTKNLSRHHLYLHPSMFTSARYTYAKIMYKCYIYIKKYWIHNKLRVYTNAQHNTNQISGHNY